MNDHRRRGPSAGRTIGPPAATPQPVRPGRQRPQRISAALLTAAGIVLAHGGRQRLQPLIQRMGIGGEQAAADLRDALAVIGEPDLAVTLALLAPPHRVRVELGHDLVDLPRQPAAAHRRPPRHLDRQLGVHRRQHLLVGDQIRAIHNRREQPKVDVAGQKHLGNLRQPLKHRAGIPHPARGQSLTDPQRRGHLGGHRLHGVDRPVLGLRAAREPIPEQPPNGVQLRGRRGFSARAATHTSSTSAADSPVTDGYCRSINSSKRAITSARAAPSNIYSSMPLPSDIDMGREIDRSQDQKEGIRG